MDIFMLLVRFVQLTSKEYTDAPYHCVVFSPHRESLMRKGHSLIWLYYIDDLAQGSDHGCYHTFALSHRYNFLQGCYRYCGVFRGMRTSCRQYVRRVFCFGWQGWWDGRRTSHSRSRLRRGLVESPVGKPQFKLCIALIIKNKVNGSLKFNFFPSPISLLKLLICLSNGWHFSEGFLS